MILEIEISFYSHRLINFWRSTLTVLSVVYLLSPTSQTTTYQLHPTIWDGCISFDSYIKPQPCVLMKLWSIGCISFDSYIKPQLCSRVYLADKVVYLLIPTSNHNHFLLRLNEFELYIFWFLHQTTTNRANKNITKSCISFDSYIKPQLLSYFVLTIRVVYLLIPTSNHNFWLISLHLRPLYIFWFLHQTTTTYPCVLMYLSCISFDSYIKPQL